MQATSKSTPPFLLSRYLPPGNPPFFFPVDYFFGWEKTTASAKRWCPRRLPVGSWITWRRFSGYLLSLGDGVVIFDKYFWTFFGMFFCLFKLSVWETETQYALHDVDSVFFCQLFFWVSSGWLHRVWANQDPKGRKRATSLGRSRALTVPAPTEVVNLDHRSG